MRNKGETTGIQNKHLHQDLYNYIDKGIFINITNKDLPVKKDKKKGSYRKFEIAHKNLKGASIEDFRLSPNKSK